jgi:hypothetical protein
MGVTRFMGFVEDIFELEVFEMVKIDSISPMLLELAIVESGEVK